MSAPDTNTKKEVRRHRPSLLGIGAAVVFALVLLFALITWVTSEGETPRDAPEIDPAAGAVDGQ